MKIGLSLCPEAGRWSDTVQQARAAVDLGYDSLWLPEHHLMTGYQPSPLLGLAGLVEVSGDLQLGTDVVVAPFHHPVRIAEDAAVLQDMSEGRFVLGLGLGYRSEEFAAFGVNFEQRGAIFEEQLEVVRLLLHRENVTFEGEHFRVADVTVFPRPESAPPIWVGGWVRPAIERAARHADAWFPGPTAELSKVARCLDVYDRELAKSNEVRSELPIFREVWVADDDALLEAGEAPLRRMYAEDYVSWNHQNVRADGDVSSDRFIVGDCESVAAQLTTLAQDLGATHLVARLHFHGIDQTAVLESMRLLAGKVRPMLEGALARG